MIKLVVFDWDGVIVDTTRMDYEIYRIITKRLGKKFPDSIEEFGKLTEGRWQTLHKNLGITTEKEITEAVETYIKLRKKMEKDVKAYEGIENLLSRLKENVMKIAVTSNNYRANIVRLMKRLGLGRYINLIIPYDHRKKVKPDPDQILECMDKFAVKPEETVFVGDMEVDVIAGKAAGVKTIAVTYGWHSRERLEKLKPDVIVNKPGEILENL